MPLKENIRVFTTLNKEKIRYCHWKSNANLSRSFDSETDFDLLVDGCDVQRFQSCIGNLGLKKRCSTGEKVYPGVEDYLGFDKTDGKMFHLHVHYKLIIGKKNQKNYRIPFESRILDTAICDEEYPIKVIRTELELVLLIIRSILKVAFGVKEFARTIQKKSIFPSNINKEYGFLRERVNYDVFYDYVKELFPDLLDIFKRMAQGNLSDLSIFQLMQFQRRITKALRPFRLFSKNALESELRTRQLSSQNSRSWLGPGGVSIAFVGSDGSGKSSMVSNINKWLGWKLSVKSLYMGLPKDHFLWQTFNFVTKALRRLNLVFLRNQFDVLRWIFVAKLRRRTYLYSEMLKNQGRIVLFDRFPLMEFWGMDEPMDGPRLRNSSRWGKLEKRLYKEIKYPDYVFVLSVNEKESVRRKAEHESQRKRHAIRKKINALDKLVQTKNSEFIIIDTLRGEELTQLEVKKIIWGLL